MRVGLRLGLPQCLSALPHQHRDSARTDRDGEQLNRDPIIMMIIMIIMIMPLAVDDSDEPYIIMP